MPAQPSKAIDLTEILEPYLNKWVALSADQTHVVGSGDSVPEALRAAHQIGEKEPVILFVPSISGPHVLIA